MRCLELLPSLRNQTVVDQNPSTRDAEQPGNKSVKDGMNDQPQCSLKAQMPKTKHELNVGDLNKDVEKNSGMIISDPTAENTWTY